MQFNFIKPVGSSSKMKASIHRTGRMGFSLETIRELNLDSKKHLKFATNGADKNDKNLYMVILTESDHETFPVIKAGTYIYINTTNTFDEMGIDYKNNRISFILNELHSGNQKYYKMIKKESERKDKRKMKKE